MGMSRMLRAVGGRRGRPMRGCARAAHGGAAVAVTAVLAACAVGPNYHRPPAPKAADYGSAPSQGSTAASAGPGGAAQTFDAGQDIPAQWWTLFHSEKLTALVAQSLKGNPDLDAARAALRQASELYKAQRTSLLPVVQGSFDAQRAKNPVLTLANPTSLPQVNPYYNLYTAQLNLSYSPDVFGGLRRSLEAARAGVAQTRFELIATYVTLSSNVVVTAVQEGSLRGQIAATTRLLQIERQLTASVRQQRALGTARELDLLSQQAAEAQTAAQLPPLEKQLGQMRDALTALLGRLPSEEPPETFTLEELSLPSELPVSLPSKLIEQRPDVRQAEENLHAASAQVGVALADMLPQFTVSADTGSAALAINKLFTPYTGFWDIGASLTQTLFDAGALIYRHRAADAALDQAGAQYRAAVILACQNVADTLRALKSDADALKAAADADEAARAAFEVARHQQELGTISLVALLNAEQTYQQAEVAVVQARAARYADTAGLFQALGGGWWNSSEASFR
jgi:NodT family efflux transporter outer membrane factor (OMF) lipoprotein